MSRLWLISFDYVDWVIPTPQFKFRKLCCITKLVENIINVRNGMSVLNGDLVERLVVDA